MKRIAGFVGCLIFLVTATHGQTTFEFDFAGYVNGTQVDSVISGTGTDFDGTTTGLLYRDIASGSGYAIDAVLSATSPYGGKSAITGATGDDVQVNQAFGQSTFYNFAFYEAGTTNLFDAGGIDYSYDLVFYDIDGFSVGLETFEFMTPGTFTLTTTTTVNQEGTSFFNQSVGNVPNPTPDDTDLDATQENASVIGTFSNTNSVDFRFTTGSGGGNRNYFIDGNDFTVFDTATAAPGAPAPPIYLIALMAIVFGLKRRFRRHEA
ncbi:MAG: hypothetical protein HRU46_20790 [Verrucomicrobiales bacterium]|nr:hypothetical protein [Verrucomicrobiales bacterium]